MPHGIAVCPVKSDSTARVAESSLLPSRYQMRPSVNEPWPPLLHVSTAIPRGYSSDTASMGVLGVVEVGSSVYRPGVPLRVP